MEFIHLPPRQSLLYSSCYCEENIYKIVELHVAAESLKHYTVMFLSNPSKSIPLFSQQLRRAPIFPVFWDYHVVLIYHPDHTLSELISNRQDGVAESSTNEVTATKSYIYDLDTTLQTFPCPFPTYFSQTFSPPPSSQFSDPEDRVYMLAGLSRERFKRYFRLIPAEIYLQYFHSTRLHMKKAEGEWIKPPPHWEIIRGEKAEGENFGEYIDFGGWGNGVEDLRPGKEYLGIVIDEDRLWEIFGSGVVPSNELIDLATDEAALADSVDGLDGING